MLAGKTDDAVHPSSGAMSGGTGGSRHVCGPWKRQKDRGAGLISTTTTTRGVRHKQIKIVESFPESIALSGHGMLFEARKCSGRNGTLRTT